MFFYEIWNHLSINLAKHDLYVNLVKNFNVPMSKRSTKIPLFFGTYRPQAIILCIKCIHIGCILRNSNRQGLGFLKGRNIISRSNGLYRHHLL